MEARKDYESDGFNGRFGPRDCRAYRTARNYS